METNKNELVIPISELRLILDFMPEYNEPTGGGKTTTISWNDLMPVVQKIRLLLNDNDLYEKSKERNFWEVIMFSFQAVSIEATYIPVAVFIKWYNQQSPNS